MLGVWLIACLSAAPGAKANPAQQAYERAQAQYYAVKSQPQKQQFRHYWQKAIVAFDNVARAYPKSPEAPKAYYTVAELWADLYSVSRNSADLEQAYSAYSRVAERYPESSLADDALLEAARVLARGDEAKQGRAAGILAKLIQRYPTGDQVKDAKALALTIKAAPVDYKAKDASTWVGRRDDGSVVPTLTDLRYFSSDTYSRVAFYLSGPVLAKIVESPEPKEGDASKSSLVVELAPAKLVRRDLTRANIAQSFVSRVEIEGVEPKQSKEPSGLRITLSTNGQVKPRLLVLENPYRVVVDAVADPVAVADATVPPSGASVMRTLSDEPVVVIDAGHGGHDPGAKGTGGLLEKDAVLAIAKLTAKELRQRGVKVVMTRDDDTFVSLEERTAIANRAHGDLFVSIHANAHNSPKVQGVETYYLDTTDDRYALRLAARENAVREERVSDLQLILADIATKSSTQGSKALAERVQRQFVGAVRKATPTRDLGVKPSLFYVLLGARMPAILLETSFITHPKEGRLLGDAKHQAKLAMSLANAVASHLSSNALVAHK